MGTRCGDARLRFREAAHIHMEANGWNVGHVALIASGVASGDFPPHIDPEIATLALLARSSFAD